MYLGEIDDAKQKLCCYWRNKRQIKQWDIWCLSQYFKSSFQMFFWCMLYIWRSSAYCQQKVLWLADSFFTVKKRKMLLHFKNKWYTFLMNEEKYELSGVNERKKSFYFHVLELKVILVGYRNCKGFRAYTLHEPGVTQDFLV